MLGSYKVLSSKWFNGLALALAAVTTSVNAAVDFATDDERNSIQVFETARPSVVFVTKEQLARDPRSWDIMSVPAGSGTGFVWSATPRRRRPRHCTP